MIGLELNEEIFEYDIYSLIKAFFPSEEVIRVSGECEGLCVRVLYHVPHYFKAESHYLVWLPWNSLCKLG